MAIGSPNLFTSSINFVKHTVNEVLNFGNKLFSLEGIDKVGSFAKPFFNLLNLQFRGEKVNYPFFTAIDGFKNVKNSFSWVKQGHDFAAKTFSGAFFEVAKRVTSLGVAILNLVDFISQNVTKSFDWISSNSFMGIKVFVGDLGKVVKNAIPLKQALGTLSTVFDLAKNISELVGNYFKIGSTQKKIDVLNNEKNADQKIYATKIQKLQTAMNTAADVLVDKTKTTEIQDEIQEIAGRVDITVPHKFAILKAYDKLVNAASEPARVASEADFHALSDMSDVTFTVFKVNDIKFNQDKFVVKNKSAWINVAVDIASLVASFFQITRLAYGAGWLASKLNVSVLTSHKIVEGIAAASGLAGLMKHVREAFAFTTITVPNVTHVKVSAAAYYAQHIN